MEKTITKKVDNDGVTHINVYSYGRTTLGRFLSNFSLCPIQTEDGKFNSIEGYWYWLSCKSDRLRYAYGAQAKFLGRELGGQDWCEEDEFRRKICQAIKIKLSTPQALDVFKKHKNILNLRLEHYYVYGNKIIRPKKGQWVIDCISECIKDYLENECN